MGPKTINKGAETSRRRLATIVVADICNYAAITEINEAGAITLTDSLFESFKFIVEKNNGRVFKRIADGFLAEFSSVNAAMSTAIKFSQDVKDRQNLSPQSIPVDVRQGVHVGDVVFQNDGDILGHSVNIAARLQQNADPGAILISANVQNLLSSDFGYKYHKRKTLTLKNITAPLTAYQYSPSDIRPKLGVSSAKRLFKPLIFTLSFISLLSLGLFIQSQNHKIALEDKIENVIAEITKNPELQPSNISVAYIRQVLHNLSQSKISSHEVSFTLLETGNITLAIETLIDNLDEMDFGSQDYTDTMHQIAALSYHHNPQRSLTYYQSLLEINEQDTVALLWLTRTYNTFIDTDKALELYDHIITSKNLPEKDALILQMEMAFSLMIEGEFQTGKNILLSIEDRVIKINDERLYIDWLVDIGIASERLDHLIDAEAYIMSAIAKLKHIGADESLPRAYNVMGLLMEKKASKDSSNEALYLTKAIEFYELQNQSGRLINRKREVAESLHFLGRVKFKLGNVEDAKEDYHKSHLLALDNKFYGSQFKARLGMAQIEKFYGNHDKSCVHVRKAEALFETKMGPNLGPMSRELITYTGCIFSPKNLG